MLIERGAVANMIGGTIPAARNMISGNSTSGVDITGSGTDSNSVIGNYIGTNEMGTSALANQFGVLVEEAAANNAIGGTVFDMANVISGNTISGISLSTGHRQPDPGQLDRHRRFRRISLGNEIGISIDASSNNIVGAAGAGMSFRETPGAGSI